MKKWCLAVPVASLFMLFMLWFKVMKDPVHENSLASLLTYNTTNPLEWINSGAPPAVQNPENGSKVLSARTIISSLFAPRNISNEEQQALQTWNHLKHLLGNAQVLPNAIDAIQEAGVAWNSLIASLEEERLASGNGSFHRKGKEKQCPHFLSKMNSTGLDNNGFKLQVPCGLTQGSSITIIGFPSGLLGNFRIDLTGEPLPGEPDPPIILHYNVRLHGDKITEDPVIVQNTWTIAHDWGEEDRCPSPDSEKNKKVDELEQCNKMVGKDDNRVLATSRHSNGSRKVGTEGIQMTVDGKHITSFAFRESLEPWLVSEVRVSGDIKLVSVVAGGLPTSEDIDHIIDLEALISSPLPSPRPLDLFIVAVRFFVGLVSIGFPPFSVQYWLLKIAILHKNQMVNEELWNEAQTYRDIQLMPFVDYYSLITWKTVAICIFGTEVASAKYVMKTDDDSFVRVDEVLASLTRINATRGLLYGLINSDSHPHRNPDSKWYISQQEWADDNYPPWAHGPGYVVSRDIAKAVYKKHKKGHLKMFKLEDVAMGIWIADMKKGGLEVRYEKEERIFNEGCRDSYVVAHYQGPREMLCLWQKLQETKEARCCGE
ncbi:galactosyltransferase1 [Actinidia rufa]|uniref:Galactosyltransferase1 n=1 Tax=Actinidia rufa TaxID=165716 RepID=A0A7J0HEM2_9ERIC|nr:galactosyltransferase1 [Actinidia rufa]